MQNEHVGAERSGFICYVWYIMVNRPVLVNVSSRSIASWADHLKYAPDRRIKHTINAACPLQESIRVFRGNHLELSVCNVCIMAKGLALETYTRRFDPEG